VAKANGLGMYAFVEGYDISGDVGSLGKVGSPKREYIVTGLDKSAEERIGGTSDGEMSFNGFVNQAVLHEHAILSQLKTTDVRMAIAFSALAGATCPFLSAKQINYDLTRPADGSLAWAVDAKGSAGVPLEWGVNLTAGKITHASAASAASLDNAAASNYGLAAQLQFCSRASGTPTFLIEHSSDNLSWSTLLTFTGTGGATPFGERKTSAVATQVKRYLRVTTTGTFTNASLLRGRASRNGRRHERLLIGRRKGNDHGEISGLGMTLAVDLSDGTTATNISNDVTGITFSTPRGEQDVTGLDKSAMERLLLLADGKVSITGVYNAALSHTVFRTVRARPSPARRPSRSPVVPCSRWKSSTRTTRSYAPRAVS
jgi:hypothetical protein